ncbi:hypothetical protein Glove_606g40 [Diversispora epigaea]|uniref:HMG box domain-containing protein n=1 Tax=Diversispora epigaea TaxID=1348612 RepID=A0A397GD25_9GLOM|nr:hypothetical protein Glove_606g40 [Diversispora epigaea]
MSEQSSNEDHFFQTYQAQQQREKYDFIIETGDKITNDGNKKSQQIAKPNQNIVGLATVPFPPRLSMEDLLKPRNDKCGKMKVPNKFFIYRKWYTKCLVDNNMKIDQTSSISPRISKQWRNESQEVRDHYGDLSKRASELFIKKYGKQGIKRKISKKPKKKIFKKITNKKLPEIQPKIKEENLNSIVTFEPPHQQHQQQHQSHLSNNFTACSFPSVQSEILPLSLCQSLINQSQQESSFDQPSVSSFLQQPSESSYPSTESFSTSQSLEQSFEMGDTYDYYPTNNNMNHTNDVFGAIYLNSGFTGFLENTNVFEGQVNDEPEYSFFNEGQVEQVIEY